MFVYTSLYPTDPHDPDTVSTCCKRIMRLVSAYRHESAQPRTYYASLASMAIITR